MSRRDMRYCDRDGCTTHAADEVAGAAGFVLIVWDGAAFDLCSTDCALHWLADRVPLTTVHGDAAGERP